MLPPDMRRYGKDVVGGSVLKLLRYHLSAHRADALLQPLDIELGTMETRAKHYLERLEMTDEDRAAVEAAYAAIQAAHAEVTRQRVARAAVPQQGAQGGKR